MLTRTAHRSSSSRQLLVPPFRLTTVGQRTFPVAASLLSPVHTSNNVQATLSNATSYSVECCFEIVAVSFLATMLPVSATMSNEIWSFRQSRNKLNMFNLVRLCRKDEILQWNPSTLLPLMATKSNVASTKSNIASTMLPVASTLLLVSTGPYGTPCHLASNRLLLCLSSVNVWTISFSSFISWYSTLTQYYAFVDFVIVVSSAILSTLTISDWHWHYIDVVAIGLCP